jgi:hypothetical protein
VKGLKDKVITVISGLASRTYQNVVDCIPRDEGCSNRLCKPLQTMESNIVNLREDQFLCEGVMRQIQDFMLVGKDSDLICQRLRETPGSDQAKPTLLPFGQQVT